MGLANPQIPQRDFLAVRGGARASVPVCLIEARKRPDGRTGLSSGPRFGFTVTKKLGNAVVRNRIRRRLKSAIAAISADHAEAGFDYVLVARSAALDRPFEDMLTDLIRALNGSAQNAAAGRSRTRQNPPTSEKTRPTPPGLTGRPFLVGPHPATCSSALGFETGPLFEASMASPNNPQDQNNLMFAVILSLVVLMGWQYFFAAPKMREEQARKEFSKEVEAQRSGHADAGSARCRLDARPRAQPAGAPPRQVSPSRHPSRAKKR